MDCFAKKGGFGVVGGRRKVATIGALKGNARKILLALNKKFLTTFVTQRLE